MNFKTKKKKGFTLTEVLVVVLVIGVISAIAYPTYTKAINKSRAVEAINLLEMVRNKQIAYHARSGEYISDFSKMGQLTGDAKNETVGSDTSKMTIGKYELAINKESSCMTASFIPAKGKDPTFVFSSSYEEPGLGCDGSICSSFGNIVGGSDSVCNCGSKDCGPGYDMDPKTCACTCTLECSQNGCSNKSVTKPLEQECGNNGKQYRTCTPSCDGGDCSSWGQCSGQSCGGAQPTGSRDCGNKCGKETGVVSCNSTTGQWQVAWSGTCSSEGQCEKGTTRDCGNGGKQTCSNTCGWGTCENEYVCKIGQVQRKTCDNNPDKYQTRTFGANGEWSAWTGDCSVDAPPTPKVCTAGASQSCGTCGKQTCNSEGTAWGSCSETPKPSSVSTACGNCGTKTDTYVCNASTASWSKITGTCKNEGVCTPGTKKLIACGQETGWNANSHAVLYKEGTCTSSCAWPVIPPCNSCRENPNCGKNMGGGMMGACYCVLESNPIEYQPIELLP